MDWYPGSRIANPRIAAFVLAVVYVVLSVVYVLTSSHVAAVTAQSVVQLEQLERIKGVVFVLGTGVLFYVVAVLLLQQVRKQQARLGAQHDALVASEHRALSGLFAASIAHDINNVTMVARGSTELLVRPLAAEETKKAATANLLDAFTRLAALSSRLMTLGRESAPSPMRESDLTQVVERAMALGRRHERVRRCRLTARRTETLPMPLDEALVDRMILNLLLNAADATRGTGRIEIRVRREGDQAIVEVHDDGPGVAEADREAIFDPFRTSKPDGLGLGLMSVKVCAEAHGGSVTVLDSDLGGACFRIALPMARQAA